MDVCDDGGEGGRLKVVVESRACRIVFEFANGWSPQEYKRQMNIVNKEWSSSHPKGH